MDEQLTDAIVGALIALIPVLAAILTYYTKGLLKEAEKKVKAEIGNEQFSTLLTFAGIFIRSAQQTMGLDSEQAKKEAVFTLLYGVAEDAGIAIRDDQLSALIEGVFNEIKGEWKA